MSPCLCAATRRAARGITRLYEQHLREAGLTAPQFGILSALLEHPGLSQHQLSTAFDLDQTTLSRNLGVLIEDGCLKSSKSKDDARLTLYAITAAGRRRRQLALPHWQRAQQQMQNALGAEWQQALVLLQRISAASPAA